MGMVIVPKLSPNFPRKKLSKTAGRPGPPFQPPSDGHQTLHQRLASTIPSNPFNPTTLQNPMKHFYNKFPLSKRWLAVFSALALVLSTSTSLIGQEESTKVDFKKQIKPLFDKYCVACHGPDDTQSFRIDQKEDAMDYVEAGKADDSQLYFVLVTDDEYELMPPPDEENPMDAKEIELVKRWIDEGADWPDQTWEEMAQEAKTDQSGVTEKTESNEAVVEEGTNQVADQESKETTDSETADPATSEEMKLDQDATDLPQVIPPAEKPKAEAEDDGIDPRIYKAIGSLHMATVHLPLGLLLGAGLFAFLSLRGGFVMSDCAYYCLWLGALGALLATVSGFNIVPMGKFKPDVINEWGDLFNTDHRIFMHRTGGLAITIFSLVLALYAASARARDPENGLLWKLGVIVLAAAVGWVGHEGGKLTHGVNHYKDLNSLAEDWIPGLFGKNGDDNDNHADPDRNQPAAGPSTPLGEETKKLNESASDDWEESRESEIEGDT